MLKILSDYFKHCTFYRLVFQLLIKTFSKLCFNFYRINVIFTQVTRLKRILETMYIVKTYVL